MIIEEWKSVPDFPGWSASNLGQIRRDGGGVVVGSNDEGYRRIQVSPDKTVAAHRMVLSAFVGPCPDGLEACHRNGIRDDNRIENLRWDTHAKNLADRAEFRRNAGVKGATKCPWGHEYTPENTYINKNKRYCRACRSQKKREVRQNRYLASQLTLFG